MSLVESVPTSVRLAAGESAAWSKTFVGQLYYNQDRPTFTGRMTLEDFTEFTVVHNKKWAEEANASLQTVTQRDIIDAHANGLALFTLQGLVAATRKRASDEGAAPKLVETLDAIQDHIGRSAHYGLPPVTMVLTGDPKVITVKEASGNVIATKLILNAGALFAVADGQHRREAARRVREFLNDIIEKRRAPKSAKFYPAQDASFTADELEAWVGVQDTFRSASLITYEAHIGLDVTQARQMFTNYNCHVKPVKAEFNLDFDQNNPINRFNKEWLNPELPRDKDDPSKPYIDLRQVAAINGFLFLGKTTIKSAPYHIEAWVPNAKEFWKTVTESTDWNRKGSLLREVSVLKGLAKAWFYVFVARRNKREDKAEALRGYIRKTAFDAAWMESVPGLKAHTVPIEGDGFRFSPAHNDIVACIVGHALGRGDAR
jgi:hypothetical protein